jgi:hypothetical protein
LENVAGSGEWVRIFVSPSEEVGGEVTSVRSEAEGHEYVVSLSSSTSDALELPRDTEGSDKREVPEFMSLTAMGATWSAKNMLLSSNEGPGVMAGELSGVKYSLSPPSEDGVGLF